MQSFAKFPNGISCALHPLHLLPKTLRTSHNHSFLLWHKHCGSAEKARSKMDLFPKAHKSWHLNLKKLRSMNTSSMSGSFFSPCCSNALHCLQYLWCCATCCAAKLLGFSPTVMSKVRNMPSSLTGKIVTADFHLCATKQNWCAPFLFLQSSYWLANRELTSF